MAVLGEYNACNPFIFGSNFLSSALFIISTPIQLAFARSSNFFNLKTSSSLVATINFPTLL